MYRVINNGQAFETLTDEGSRQELLESWSTLDQRIFNAMHETCPACNGQGYKVERVGKQIIRHQGGCYECLGIGVLPKAAA